jgi:hypothetical protein
MARHDTCHSQLGADKTQHEFMTDLPEFMTGLPYGTGAWHMCPSQLQGGSSSSLGAHLCITARQLQPMAAIFGVFRGDGTAQVQVQAVKLCQCCQGVQAHVCQP